MVLAARTGESAELVVHTGVLGEVPVAREDKDVTGGGTESLVIVEHVPHTWGAVLGCAEAAWVDKALAGGGVSAEQSGKTPGFDSLVAEELDQVVGTVKGRWEETVRGGNVAVAAADEGADAGTAGKRYWLA